MDSYPEEFYTIALPWLTSRFIQKVRTRKFTDPSTGKEYDVRLWILWHVRHGFVHIWPWKCPTGGMIARRISLTQVQNWEQYSDLEAPYVFDPDGDGVWMDFLWAPGQKVTVLKILEELGINWGAWEHRRTGSVHIKSVQKLLRMPAFNDSGGITVI